MGQLWHSDLTPMPPQQRWHSSMRLHRSSVCNDGADTGHGEDTILQEKYVLVHQVKNHNQHPLGHCDHDRYVTTGVAGLRPSPSARRMPGKVGGRGGVPPPLTPPRGETDDFGEVEGGGGSPPRLPLPEATRTILERIEGAPLPLPQATRTLFGRSWDLAHYRPPSPRRGINPH